ncbi:MAG: hypothetical protein ACRDKZ_15100 [Actinomycetota bacterium]
MSLAIAPFAHGEPAAGAPLGDLIPAAIVGLLLVAAVAVFGVAHRSGRTRILTRAGDFSARLSGLPGWAALPAAVTGGSLLIAVFGFYWDVSTHIDSGRDPGPFANASHFYIIAGLAGIALAGILSCLLGSERTPTSVRLREGWHVPVGGLLLVLCGGIAVLGFPLDDIWHRLFGQDVTLWSPTHIQMVGGASLSTLALWILMVEGGRAPVDPARAERNSRIGEVLAAGAMLTGVSAFQAEFDYSVPQFRLLYHPVLLMLSAGTVLVAARIRLGRGAALKAVVFFLALRGVLSLAIGPGLGHTTLHFPLYLVEALAVEGVALMVGTKRRLFFGVCAGAAIGTAGLAAEWGWSHLWMTMSWPASLLPEGLLLGVPAGVAGGALGAYIGRALSTLVGKREPGSRWAAVATAAGVLLLMAWPFSTNAEIEGRVDVRLDTEGAGENRAARVEMQVHPADVAEGSEWFNVTAWQDGGSFVEELVPVGPGRYRTRGAFPISGEWKTLVRLHRDESLMAVPIYLPEDSAIPAPEVPARDRFTRPLMSDKKIVLREAKDVSSGLTYAASGILVALVAAWVTALGLGLRRLEAGSTTRAEGVTGGTSFGDVRRPLHGTPGR